MNRGVLQSTAPVQQNWRSVISSMRPPQPPPFFVPPSASATNYHFPTPSSSSLLDDELAADYQSLSQLLLGGLEGCDQKGSVKVKLERGDCDLLDQYREDDHHQTVRQAWSDQLMVGNDVSKSVGISGNALDFSNINKQHHHHDHHGIKHPAPDPSPNSGQCNTGSSGGALKRARVQVQPASPNHSPFKVRKEKLGDRITALHQLVCPFGKTDTASVLLEATGYIRFLHNQIEALSLPYLGSASAASRRHHHSVHGDRNCTFPEHPGQLLNDNGMKKKEVAQQETGNDLRSRGLCLVPVSSCTLPVGSDNGADFWAPAAFGGLSLNP